MKKRAWVSTRIETVIEWEAGKFDSDDFGYIPAMKEKLSQAEIAEFNGTEVEEKTIEILCEGDCGKWKKPHDFSANSEICTDCVEAVKDEFDPIKIEAIVRMNNGFAYVLSRPLNFRYTKYRGNLIIGRDGCFLDIYSKYVCQFDKAFAGRKFQIKLTDGTIEECVGQWWAASGSEEALRILGIKETCDAPYSTVQKLKDCYVFYSGDAIQPDFKALVDEYKGKIYDYREYEDFIRGKK